MSRFINPVPQFWLNDGSIASSGKMVFFENGDYSTKKDTYSQSDNTIPNTNPVTLDGSGRMPACFGDGLYSVKFYAYDNAAVDKLGTLQWTRDDVSLSELTGQFSAWSPLTTYLAGDIVRASDGDYYRSLVGANIGNNPTTSPTQWELLIFLTQYNANRTYQINDVVINDGLLYRCNTADLIGNAPPSAQWDGFSGIVAGNLTVSGITTSGSFVTASSLTCATVAASAGVTVGNVAQAGATILDWYEEGTFTPLIVGQPSPGVGTYTIQSGTYTRIGNRVYYEINLGLSAHTSTDFMYIEGLPYPAAAVAVGAGYSASVTYSGLVVAAGWQLCPRVVGSSIEMLRCDPSGTAAVIISIDPVMTYLNICGSYRV